MRDLYELKREREEKWKREGRPEPRGTARVVEKDFDLDEMKRYVIFQLDPPLDGESMRMAHYGAATADDMMPMPMTDEQDEFSIRRIARSWGYTLID